MTRTPSPTPRARASHPEDVRSLRVRSVETPPCPSARSTAHRTNDTSHPAPVRGFRCAGRRALRVDLPFLEEYESTVSGDPRGLPVACMRDRGAVASSADLGPGPGFDCWGVKGHDA